MKNYRFIKELEPRHDSQTLCLYKINEEYYIVSRVIAFDHKEWETMIFQSNKTGDIENYLPTWQTRGWEPIQDTMQDWLETNDDG